MSRKLIKRAEELLLKEKGTVYKEHGGRVSVCLVYPNTYRIGMSSLGFQGIYTLLNARGDVVCERAFLPDDADMAEYQRTGTELFSLESKTPLGRFNIVAFSVSFENDYPNMLRVLNLAHIPLESARRAPNHPLVIMGGVCATSNPEPVAEFADICFVGEAEDMLVEFIDAYKVAQNKDELKLDASRIEGVYVPSFYDVLYNPDGTISRRIEREGAPRQIRRRCVEDISSGIITPSIITPETEFSEMYLLEAMRGCPWSCNFCLAGHLYNPPRRKSLDAIRAEVAVALGKTTRVGLVGPSLGDSPHVTDALSIPGVDFSITSLRASPKSAEIVRLMRGHKSVSIAPEAGTERLRQHINKKITEDEILETARLIMHEGIKSLRLYFMVGLPTETMEDIHGVVELSRKIRGFAPGGNVSLTLSTFVPKPFTPFERMPMEQEKIVKERMGYIKKSFMNSRGVSVFHDSPKYAYMQGLLSVGDRRIGGVIRAMLDEPNWKRAAAISGVDADFYMMRRKSPDELLPWSFILC